VCAYVRACVRVCYGGVCYGDVCYGGVCACVCVMEVCVMEVCVITIHSVYHGSWSASLVSLSYVVFLLSLSYADENIYEYIEGLYM